jgi:hypothetical protein
MSIHKPAVCKVALLLISLWFVFVTATDAPAYLLMGIDDGTTFLLISDQTFGDSNPAEGAITFNGPISGSSSWLVNVTTGLSKPVLGSATIPHMDLNTVSVTSTAGGTLNVFIMEDGFTGPISGGIAGPFIFGAGGTTGGEVTLRAMCNEFFLGNYTQIGDALSFNTSPWSGKTSGTVSLGGAEFELAILATITHAGAAVTSFDAELQADPVPIPGAIFLFAPGLAGLIAIRRRFKK